MFCWFRLRNSKMMFGAYILNFLKYFSKVDCWFLDLGSKQQFDKRICGTENPKLGLSDNYESLT